MEWRQCIVRKGGGGIFNDSRGKEPFGEFKIGGSMESLVEMVQIERSLQNYVNFTLWKKGFVGLLNTITHEFPGAPPPGPPVPWWNLQWK